MRTIAKTRSYFFALSFFMLCSIPLCAQLEFNLRTSIYAPGRSLSDPAFQVISPGLSYNIFNLRLELNYEVGLFYYGTNKPTLRQESNSNNRFLLIKEGGYSQYRSTQILINFEPKIKSVQPIIGLGVVRNFKSVISQSSYFSDQSIFSSEIEISPFWEMVFRLGFKMNRFSVILSYQNGSNQGLRDGLLGFGTTYSLSKFDEKKRPQRLNRNRRYRKNKDVKHNILRAEIGFRNKIPIFSKHTTMGMDGYAELLFKLFKDKYLGFVYEKGGISFGIDKETFEIIYQDDNVEYRSSSKSEDIVTYGLEYYFLNLLKSNHEISFLSGICYYEDVSYLGQNSFGTISGVKFRSGLFSTGINLNIPFSNLPVFVNIRFGIGLGIN